MSASKHPRQLLHERAFAEYEANPKRCLFCGAKLPYEKRMGKFCNHTCSARHNNRGVQRNFKGHTYCECGKLKKRANRYCDECIEARVYNPQLALEDMKSDKSRRLWLLRNRGARCEGCELTEWRGKPIPLEVHHQDGDADNNTQDNLQLLCPNCHAQTDTHKSANRGNSKRQQMRRKRYADGLTW